MHARSPSDRLSPAHSAPSKGFTSAGTTVRVAGRLTRTEAALPEYRRGPAALASINLVSLAFIPEPLQLEQRLIPAQITIISIEGRMYREGGSNTALQSMNQALRRKRVVAL